MTTKIVTVIHCWSAPRSRSTALLYSFEARGADCVAMDEPLYREWLISKGDSVERPYMEQLVQGIPPEGSEADADVWMREAKSLKDRICEAAESLPETDGVVFCKHMAKHAYLYDFQEECEHAAIQIVHKHVLLIREPFAVLSAWSSSGDVHGGSVAMEEVGYVQLMSIYSNIEGKPDGIQPTIVDADDLAKDPTGALTDMCTSLGFEFAESMLQWNAGPHKCDGPWASYWYQNVHKSEGWVQDENSTILSNKYRTLNPELVMALKASIPAYDFLRQFTMGYKTRGPPADQIYEDPRNANLLVYIGAPGRGRLMPRQLAAVSPWDSAVQGGDAAWEGLRVYNGKILSLHKHLRRLIRSAKALGFENVHTKDQIIEAIFEVLAANGMRDQTHMRLTLTRGEKCTSSMNPIFNVYGTTLIILPEWKPAEGATTYDNSKGISLISASQRRNPPSCVDSKIHHNNLINNILPKIQANLAGVADAIMLDVDGYVSETNATNIFMVDDDGVLLTPHGDHCLPGITRDTVITLAGELGIPYEVRRVSLAEFHAAEEVFTTGTMGELTPVTLIDGRTIGDGVRGPVTKRLQDAYKNLPHRSGWATSIPAFG